MIPQLILIAINLKMPNFEIKSILIIFFLCFI